MVVEGENADAAMRQPVEDFRLGIEIEGLVAQMEARVRAQFRLQPLDRSQQRAGVVSAAQARLPGPSDAVEGGGDAARQQGAVGVAQRQVDVEGHFGPRHDVPLEGVAMAIDEARQHEQAGGVQPERAAVRRGVERSDDAVGDCDIGALKPLGQKRLAVPDQDRHARLHSSVMPGTCAMSSQHDRAMTMNVIEPSRGRHRVVAQAL